MQKSLTSLLETVIEFVGTKGFDLLFFVIIAGSILLLINRINTHSKQKELFRLIKEESAEKDVERKKVKWRYFQKLDDLTKSYYVFSTKQERAKTLYYGILGIELAVFIGFAVWMKFFIALLLPLMIHFFACKTLQILSKNIHYFIQKELPVAIKHFVKTMTRVSDLKSVMFEVSKNLKEPLRTKFFDLSRKMVTENYEVSLMEFSEDLDNSWIYAFVFLLMSYKEQSKKADVIKNLTELADRMEKENSMREKTLTEKKSIVILNYCLLVFSPVALVGNLMFNKYAVGFFFGSIGGMMAFMLGILATFGTFMINLMLTRKTL